MKRTAIYPGSFDVFTNENVGANYVIRGMRNGKDFLEEMELKAMYELIDPSLQMVYFVPPVDSCCISSSNVKSLLALKDWHRPVSKLVHSSTLKALIEYKSRT